MSMGGEGGGLNAFKFGTVIRRFRSDGAASLAEKGIMVSEDILARTAIQELGRG